MAYNPVAAAPLIANSRLFFFCPCEVSKGRNGTPDSEMKLVGIRV